MNMVSFYIPWDFHEPVEGKFDFDGTTDEDGDGNPDYPSRDVKTFIRMIKERGFKYIMVRPGPYINALLTTAIVAATGNVYAGLWYPVSVAGVTCIIGALFLRNRQFQEQ